jgi:hypothetical protein
MIVHDDNRADAREACEAFTSYAHSDTVDALDALGRALQYATPLQAKRLMTVQAHLNSAARVLSGLVE